VISSADELLAILQLNSSDVDASNTAASDFAFKVPRAFAQRMVPGDPRDPLLLQVLATANELELTPGYSTDPLAEQQDAHPQPGIIRKYRSRALLVTTGTCAVHCRYCFRRHFPYSENNNSRAQWRETLQELAQDTDINEIILSGGDPLVLTDTHLGELVEHITTMPSIKRLRIHSRLPVVIPDRITTAFTRVLSSSGLQLVMVIHANHGNEIDAAVGRAMDILKDANITLLNQSVLLRGINDNPVTLAALSEKLFGAGVLPYYLHLLDPVQGAAHFDVPEQRAKRLLDETAALLPGFLVPRLMREEPGASSKTLIA